jgi:hypothetical protein
MRKSSADIPWNSFISNIHSTQGRDRLAHQFMQGRFDAAISKVCFELLLETFGRTIGRDLGEPVDAQIFRGHTLEFFHIEHS